MLSIIAGLDQTTLDRKGVVSDWSIKNVLAHIAAWEEWVVQVLPVRISTGVTPEDFRARAKDEARFNADEVAEREEQTPSEQLAALERTRADLLTFMRGLDRATLARQHPWDSWRGTVPEYLLAALRNHEAEHVEALRTAVAQMSG